MTGNPYEPQQPQTGYSDPSAGYQPYPPQQQGYTQPGYGQPYPPQQQVNPYLSYRVGMEHPQGTIVLVLGICGFVTGGITGLIAWIMGRKVLKEIDASGQQYTNRGNVHIGYVLGIVTTLLYGIGALIYVGFIVIYLIFIVGMLGAAGTY